MIKAREGLRSGADIGGGAQGGLEGGQVVFEELEEMKGVQW